MVFQLMKCDISQSPSLYIYIIPDVGCNGRGWDQGYRSQRCRLKGHKGIGTRVLGPGLGRRAPEGFAIIPDTHGQFQERCISLKYIPNVNEVVFQFVPRLNSLKFVIIWAKRLGMLLQRK